MSCAILWACILTRAVNVYSVFLPNTHTTECSEGQYVELFVNQLRGIDKSIVIAEFTSTFCEQIMLTHAVDICSLKKHFTNNINTSAVHTANVNIQLFVVLPQGIHYVDNDISYYN